MDILVIAQLVTGIATLVVATVLIWQMIIQKKALDIAHNDADANMSADPEYQKLQDQLKDVAIEGTIEEEIRPIIPARNAIKLKSPIRSEIIIIDAPLNPKKIPIHWYLVRVSFKKILARKDVRIGCNETINAIRVADIPLDKAKKTPPKYKPWNNNPLIDASIKDFNEIFLFFEKKIKNKNKNNATTLNLIERDRKGGA